MSAKTKIYKTESMGRNVPRPKTLHLRLAVTGRDWQREVKRAFDLAKSGGRELDATFTLGAS